MPILAARTEHTTFSQLQHAAQQPLHAAASSYHCQLFRCRRRHPSPVVHRSTAMATSTARLRSGRGKTATNLTEIRPAPVVHSSPPMETSTARRRSRRGKTATTLTEIPSDPVVHSSTPRATSLARRRSGRRTAATTLTDIPDHLVAEIFLRLPAAEDLARASAACVSFRRLVTDKSFLRRFRRLHDPPLLAFFDLDGLHHALPPHPSAPAASALAAAADFSFSFFPNHRQWSVQDIRDGRVLLIRPAGRKQLQVSMELAVCDPLHRGYILLPPVPDDLADSVAHLTTGHEPWSEAFLVPLEEEPEAAFSVMWMVHFPTRLSAFVYSSTTGQWLSASKEWYELFLERGESTMVSPIDRNFYGRHYAYGCFYWESTTIGKKELLVFDTRRMEFSCSDIPPREPGIAIVEAGEGRLGLFSIRAEAGKFDLCYYIKGIKCESSSQWQLEKTISIGSGCGHDIKAATGKYLLLGKFGAMRFVDSTPEMSDLEYISFDVKTLQLARVCTKSSGFAYSKTWIYTNFSPSLSSPTI